LSEERKFTLIITADRRITNTALYYTTGEAQLKHLRLLCTKMFIQLML